MTPTPGPSSAPHEVLRRHHDVLVDALRPLGLAARQLPGLHGDDVRARVDSALTYLHDDVLRHAHAEEMALLPALVHSPGGTSAAGSLHAEHDTVRVAAAQLGELALRPLTPPTVAHLAGLLGGVHAMLERHLAREADSYTPLLEGLDPEERQRLQSQLLTLGEARPDVVHWLPEELPVRMPLGEAGLLEPEGLGRASCDPQVLTVVRSAIAADAAGVGAKVWLTTVRVRSRYRRHLANAQECMVASGLWPWAPPGDEIRSS